MSAPSTVAAPQVGLRPRHLLGALAVFLGATLLGLFVGAVGLPLRAVVLELIDQVPGVHVNSGLTTLEKNLLLQIRLPRVLAAALVGGLLAIAGAGYQGVFRNPLADPYLLGAAAGAGVGATAVITLLPGDPALTVPVAAFVGALAGVALAYALGNLAGSGTATLLLAGVAVSAFLSAVQTFLMQSDAQQLQRIYSWVLGGVGTAEWPQLLAVLPYAVVSVAVLLLHGRLLDLLGVGDEEATALGLSAQRVRVLVLAAASLATATAVAVGGLIGFVGIVVPHLVRRFGGASYRAVLPLSLLVGAAFLVLADVLARTVVSPGELPLGVVTAFIGGPFFVIVLRAMRGRAGL